MGRRLSHTITLAVALCVACFLVPVGVPRASTLEFEEVPAEIEPAHIVMLQKIGDSSPLTTPHRRTFTFAIKSGYCVGGPKPRIDHVTVVERPKTAARPFKSTVITVFLLHPAHLRVIPPSPPPQGVSYNVCAGIGLTFVKLIKLKRPVADLFFYDGSYSYPRRVWPP